MTDRQTCDGFTSPSPDAVFIGGWSGTRYEVHGRVVLAYHEGRVAPTRYVFTSRAEATTWAGGHGHSRQAENIEVMGR